MLKAITPCSVLQSKKTLVSICSTALPCASNRSVITLICLQSLRYHQRDVICLGRTRAEFREALVYRLDDGSRGLVALTKVDPAYPPELMRDRIEGTVTVYAVIHSDGTVGDLKVLRGVDERLDSNAMNALSRWR